MYTNNQVGTFCINQCSGLGSRLHFVALSFPWRFSRRLRACATSVFACHRTRYYAFQSLAGARPEEQKWCSEFREVSRPEEHHTIQHRKFYNTKRNCSSTRPVCFSLFAIALAAKVFGLETRVRYLVGTLEIVRVECEPDEWRAGCTRLGSGGDFIEPHFGKFAPKEPDAIPSPPKYRRAPPPDPVHLGLVGRRGKYIVANLVAHPDIP